jgi:hypothetical protein
MITVGSLAGEWHRSLLALPDGARDTTSIVTWLQAHPHFADLRQPPEMPDFSHARGLDDLTAEDCGWLATQQGFAGFFRRLDDGFEWVRLVDFCPPGPLKDIGRLYWDGDILVEEGRDAPYLEHWHRNAARAVTPAGSFLLEAPETAAPAILLRVGAGFMYARGRPAPLPQGDSLAGLVAATADLPAARRLLDCEISHGMIAGAAWRITRSTLPFRVGGDLAPRLDGGVVQVAERAPSGVAGTRRWRVIEAAGDTSALFDI